MRECAAFTRIIFIIKLIDNIYPIHEAPRMYYKQSVVQSYRPLWPVLD